MSVAASKARGGDQAGYETKPGAHASEGRERETGEAEAHHQGGGGGGGRNVGEALDSLLGSGLCHKTYRKMWGMKLKIGNSRKE